ECATREMGKTLPEAKGETARGIAILRYYAGEGLRKTGDVIPSTDSSAFMYTDRVHFFFFVLLSTLIFTVSIQIFIIYHVLFFCFIFVFFR
ncbi:hypothetical protein B0E34_20615, partial [Chryseobacterium mucoviscidosis]